MLAPDPQGSVNGNARSADYVRRASTATLAHEFQHLINASRRIYVNDASDFEETWLDEGLSHVAEELSFYAASGLAPGENLDITRLRSSQAILDAVNEYQVNNLSRYASYLRAPQANSPVAPNDSLATRGATWAFLRYAADRRGGDQAQLWSALVNSTTSGVANLQAALGADPLPWLRDWSVSTYADDAVGGIAPAFGEASWNYRSTVAALVRAAFPLSVQTLSDGAPSSVDVHGGSAAYLRFAVDAGQRGELRLALGTAPGSGGCTAAGPARSLAVGQSYSATLADTADLCFDGGGAGSEFVLVPFYATTDGSATAHVSVAASGVTAPAGPPTPDRSPFGALFSLSGLSAAQGGATGDGGWERALRERERRELRPLIRAAGRAPAPRPATAAAPASVQLVVLRTR